MLVFQGVNDIIIIKIHQPQSVSGHSWSRPLPATEPGMFGNLKIINPQQKKTHTSP